MNNPLKELSQLHEELDTNPQPQEQTQDSSTTSPDESPAGCGPNRRVAEMAFRSVYADRLGEPAMEPKAVGIDPSVERMEAYVKWLGLEPVAVGSLLLQGQENGPDELVGVLFPIALRKLKEGDLIYSADTIAALTKERDIWAEASKAKAERLTALQAENVELRKREEWFANLFERKWNGVVGAGTRYTYHLRGDWRHMVGALSGDTLSAAIDAAMKGVSDGN